MKLLIATGNRHKFQEIGAILRVPHLQLIGLRELGPVPDVVEDGDTFEANAVKKAVTLARFSGLWTLADDSGLEVEALGNAPGVWSARYAGEPANDTANNAKLLANMQGRQDRRARFRCAIALADPRGTAHTVSGSCEGTLLAALRGAGGFGYDPLFVPEGYAVTYAELDPDVKNAISHRARALAKAMEAWGAMLAPEPAVWPTE
jgi:XTP/dITP diphosphohydrolase